jgi:hypothetical protein
MPQDGTANSGNGATTAGATGSLDLPAGMFRSGDTPEKTTIAMSKRFGRFEKLTNVEEKFYTDVDGLALFEGDIVLATTEEARAAATAADKGVGISGEQYRWPKGVVPYVTVEELRPKVEAAIAHWEERTPIRFRQRTNQRSYVSFEVLGGCWSRVGRQGGKQEISLGSQCSVGSAIHEIGHTLGLWHEQSRADRDTFIEIVEENIDPQHLHNFDQHILDGDDLGRYDHASIMHYPATAFSVNGQPTIRVKGGQPIGQRNGLSEGDVAAIRLMYPDLKWPKSDEATTSAETAAVTG